MKLENLCSHLLYFPVYAGTAIDPGVMRQLFRDILQFNVTFA